MASKGWQHPYVNIFKHVKVEEWKKTAKEGDVSTYTDKTLKCPVFRISGPLPANSFIHIPKKSNQSLGLTGRFFYLLFRPTPGKYFVVHLDVATEEGQVVRISFSNMFKVFKSTPTWLQFPFLCGAAKDSVYDNTSKSARHGLVGSAPSSVRWTCLMLDLQYMLSVYANRCHSHLKSIRLCANMSVKNMFTSDLLLNPGVSFHEAKLMGMSSSQGTGPIPREMSFPVPKGSSWHDFYDHIRFPSEGTKLPFDSIQKYIPQQEDISGITQQRLVEDDPPIVTLSKAVQDRVSLIKQVTTPEQLPQERRPIVANIPELGVVTAQQNNCIHHSDDEQESLSSMSQQLTCTPPCEDDGAGVHVYVHHHKSIEDKPAEKNVEEPGSYPSSKSLKRQKLLPDPILRLKGIIGFGGGTSKCALWTKAGDAVVYPCHAIIVSMKINTNEQRFFIGHSDKVSALAFNGTTTLLASAQTGNHSMVRVWDYHKGTCLALFTGHIHSLFCLSLSSSGSILCGVGKDRHNKTMVLVWNTSGLFKGGDVTVLAKAHTDVDIHTMKIAFFDDTRIVSCGRDNIRLWRVRNGTLRSCPVNLGEYHSMDFSDVAFEEGLSPDLYVDDRTLFASSRSGHIFEIDYSRVVIKNVRRLLPAQQQHADRREKLTFNTGPGISINCISISSSFCATGSEDGFLRLWPLDFSSVFLEAEHEGPVSVVSVSFDSMQVLSATSTGNLGFLDVGSQGYNTLMRSHTDTVLSFSVDKTRRHLSTASSDGTICIWDMDSLHQLYDFASEDTPSSVAFHPSQQIFSCGFSSGIIRIFDISSAKLLAELRQLRGEVVGLAFSPDGEFMYSADSQGSLLLHNSSEDNYNVIRVLGNAVARGSEHAPDAITVSSDSRCLAFVGPSQYIVTICDARSLNELLRVDVSILDLQSTQLDSALKVCFAPASTEHLLVATSANKIIWVSTKTGRLIREVSNVHKLHCSCLAVSEDSRFLLTAGNNTLKVWDYSMQLHVNSQMFIGHSQTIRQVRFLPEQSGVVTVGDAIFLWDFLGNPADLVTGTFSQLRGSLLSPPKDDSHTKVVQLCDWMPRQTAPLPNSSPPQLLSKAIDQVTQGALGSSVKTVSSPNPNPGSSCEPRAPVSFLKVTDLLDISPLKSNPVDSVGFKQKNPVRPDCYRHFIPHFKTSSFDQVQVTAAPTQAHEEGLKLKAVIGYNGNGRGNMVWSPDQGLFAYTCGCVIVVEYLHSGSQKHLLGHREEISCLALTNDAKTMASAAGSANDTTNIICLWDIPTGTCCYTIPYHKGAVQSLSFSRDDRFLLSVGDFLDPDVALWSRKNMQLLWSERMSGPIHDSAFSPSAASQMACVGSQGLYFCWIHTQGSDVDLKVQRVDTPADVGKVELTSLSYHMDNFLFTGTNRGHVCAWDTNQQQCLMTWEADSGEIGALLCKGNRLLTGSNSRWLRLWEVEAVQCMRPKENVSKIDDSLTTVLMEHEIMLDGTIVSAAFDNTMDMGIVGTTAGTLWYINWWDNSSIRLVSGHKTEVNDVVFSSDESHFATCSEDGSVRVWSTISYELVVQFQVLTQACACVCWSPCSNKDDARVAAGYSDGTLRIFSLASTEMEMKLQPHHTSVSSIQYSSTGHVILSAGNNGLVAVSSPVNGATLRVFSDHKRATVTTIQCVNEECKNFGVEGNEMWLAAGSDRRVSVWAADWLKEKCDLLDWLTFPAPPHSVDDSLPPSLAAFCPSDHSLVIYTGYAAEKELSFYSLVKKQIIKKIALPHWATCMSLSSKSQLIAIGSRECVLKLIKINSGRFQDFLQHSDSLQTCCFSPSGAALFSVAFNEILLWEVNGL
ncbi:WD repeat-containing protein 90 isoform X1 [Gouania willdenowi]|uniref:WD repeat-containing protein 90 isoform X1 n=1 Tax=Gouania willdenowi TaxID=441366 RepID=UPI00105604BA|nr:WD repeat-containing protein 90-like isoform X1 [Gouania willdenowi]